MAMLWRNLAQRAVKLRLGLPGLAFAFWTQPLLHAFLHHGTYCSSQLSLCPQ